MKYAILICFLLGGCEAVAPLTAANMKLAKSQEALRACILAHPTDGNTQCQTQRELYDIDIQAARSVRQP